MQEIGYDDDIKRGEAALAIAAATGSELVDGAPRRHVVDVVLLWWLEEDGDPRPPAWTPSGSSPTRASSAVTPKPGRDGRVEASDIADAAPTAGLQAGALRLRGCGRGAAAARRAPKASRR